MIKNYFKIAWRNLLRNRLYTILNIAGLSVGLACALVVFWFIRFQTTHDHFHKNIDRIYQVTTEFHFDGTTYSRGVPAPMWKAMRTEMPSFTTSMCIAGWGQFFSVLGNDGKVIKKFKEEGPSMAYVQPEYFSIFDLKWQVSNAKKALSRPNTIVLSRKIADKYFGKENPIGRRVRLNNQLDLEVTGIVDEPAEASDMPYTSFVSFETLVANPKYSYGGSGLDHWGGVSFGTQCFTLLPEGYNIKTAEKQLVALSKKYHGNDYKSYDHYLVPFKEMHHSERYRGSMPMKWIYIMSAIGIFLIITACFNFINMATAQALRRSKEVGVRKAVGGTRHQVFIQFMLETALITLFAMATGFTIAYVLLPHISDWLGQPGSWPAQVNFTDTMLWVFLAGLFFIVVLLAGSYPGTILAGFRPVLALKGNVTTRHIGGISLRRGLIVFQFVLIQLLVICTIVVNNQVDYMLSSSVGYETRGLASIRIPAPDKVNQTTFRQRSMEIPGVADASFFIFSPTTNSNNSTNVNYDNRPKDELLQINTKNADNHYIQTFGLTLLAGENIPESDTIRGYLVNEKVLEKLGIKRPQDAIGKMLSIWDVKAPIYGVLKNWNNTSLKNGVDHVAIFTYRDFHYTCGIKLTSNNVRKTMKSVEQLWSQYFPDYMYEQSFLTEEIATSYELENTMLKLIRTFSVIAIFIGCLGLYGLVKFMASQKTKEIGVRKVLGANLSGILGIFGKEIGLLIGVAFLIAAPLGWYVMQAWLQDYENRIPIGPGILFISVLVTLLVAGVTAAYESVKAALTDPVKSLRTE
ncbi:ABC transporter permease [Dyadobacter luticola]|uniref:FtsX-like permease family protein n=1 Tax=Dyadobacter luticola TaxID=1979387 RepID=A0A5R9L2G0_9BACT|nr:ABC transporter permease [Dyadobacter luticola]TLV02723.1 FtsX-like permease family protein [Dyadobacter luticola]